MSSVNKVFLLGVAESEPEVSGNDPRRTAAFQLVTVDVYTDKGGQRQERSEHHSVVVYGKAVDFAANYIRVGSRVHVEGRVVTRSWDDQRTGRRQYQTEVHTSEVVICGSASKAREAAAPAAVKDERQQGPPPAQATQAPQASQPRRGPDETRSPREEISDDIPF